LKRRTNLPKYVYIAQRSHVWVGPRMNRHVVTVIEGVQKWCWIGQYIGTNHEMGGCQILSVQELDKLCRLLRS